MERLNVFIQEGMGGDLRLRTIGSESQIKAVALQVAQLAVENQFEPVVIASVPGDLNTIKILLEKYKTPTAGKASIYQTEPVLTLLKGLGTRMTSEAKKFEDTLAAYYGQEMARTYVSPNPVNRISNTGLATIQDQVRSSLTEHIQALAAVGLITADDLLAIATKIETSS
ncbi:hypothetical protein [Streptosporangium subroseum]|uniref:hypothetical protein n=1 Tax=Streptosporangium subroseum TaxID=106412 RepID=UPI00308EB176|nr:hypothetical protein OHB15_30570 [Streptosporangium subroseum]